MIRFFGFRTLKLRFFGFGVLHGLRTFSNLVVSFRFLSTMIALFFSAQCIRYGFLVYLRGKSHPAKTETVIPRDNLYNARSALPFRGMDGKPGLFSSHYRLGCQADCAEKFKITSK